MTRERAKTLASKWSAGCVCSLRSGEAEEYHKMFYDILCEKQYVKPETNADRIRAMSDEEMAELLLDSCRGSKCEDQPKNEWGSVNCFKCRMNWLQQPAGEKKHGV